MKHWWAVEFITKNSLFAIKYLHFYDLIQIYIHWNNKAA